MPSQALEPPRTYSCSVSAPASCVRNGRATPRRSSRVPVPADALLRCNLSGLYSKLMMPREDRPDSHALGAWRLPDELADLADTVRRFMASEVRPLEDTLPHDTTGLPDDLLLPLQEKARRLGLWSLSTPEEFGGAGLGVLGQAVVAEEAAKCRMGAYFPALGAFAGNPPSVMFSASPELFDRYAAPMIAGR